MLEALVAALLIGAAAVGALTVLSSQYDGIGRARDTLVASTLAVARLDMIRLADFSPPLQLTDSLTAGRYAAEGTSYEWSARVAPVRASPQLFDVVVTVTWPGGRHELQSRVYRNVSP